MDTCKQATKTENIACEVCLKEIPQSEAKVVEVDDYVVNFCGLECYEKWQKEEAKKD